MKLGASYNGGSRLHRRFPRDGSALRIVRLRLFRRASLIIK
jgi:hypothetical protein